MNSNSSAKFRISMKTLCSRPEDGLRIRCRQGVKPPFTPHSAKDYIIIERHGMLKELCGAHVAKRAAENQNW